MFIPLSLLGPAGFPVWTLLSLLALWRVTSLLVTRSGLRLAGFTARQLVALLVLIALPLEPFVKTLWYGQINVLLMWLIVEAFFGPSKRYNPALLAIAAAVKLTPAVFALFFMTVRTNRDRLVLMGTGIATIVFGFLLQRNQAELYWTKLLLNADRVGPTEYVYNQSLNGMLWRLLGEGGLRSLWLILAIVIAIAGLVMAWFLWNARQQVWAIGVVALATLLISPISWSHHYVLILVVLIALVQDARLTRTSGILAFVSYALMLAANVTFKLIPHSRHAEFNLHGWRLIGANQYVVLALILLIYSALRTRRIVAI